MDKELRIKFFSAPRAPGVYLMKDASGEVIYIGKAKSLRKRLMSYLGRDLSAKPQVLISKVCDIEFKLCSNESMALLLEAGLVHKYKPKYNTALRDDKSFPMVKITNEDFPSIMITRRRKPDGARYFGPYASSGLLRQAMKTIRRNFPYFLPKQMPQEARFDRSIGLSPLKEISREEYLKRIKSISLILDGKADSLLERLSEEMHERSGKKDFEGAARIRDQITALGIVSRSFNAGFESGGPAVLKRFLKLQKEPVRIEAFDISNISGKEACGSMVSFYSGKPDKMNYRRFRIRTVNGVDDYGMLREVIRRRYSRVLRDNLAMPDLIIIDGGKGHLSAVQGELAVLGLDIPLLSIAKKEENIYIKGEKYPVKLSRYPAGLNLIRRVRDEAHRFAISYHHLLRKKRLIGK